MISINTDVQMRLSVDQYIANLYLWTTPIRITTANIVSVYALSVAFHWVPRSVFWNYLVLFYELLYIQVSLCYNVVNNTFSDVQHEEIFCSWIYRQRHKYSFLTSNLYIFWSKWIYLIYSIQLPGRNYWLIVSWSNLPLKAWRWLRAYSNLHTTCCTFPTPTGSCSSCPQFAGVSLTSSAPCSSCPWLAEASLRPISSAYILMLVYLLLKVTFLLLLLNPFVVLIRAEYVILVTKIHLPAAGQHLDHTAQ